VLRRNQGGEIASLHSFWKPESNLKQSLGALGRQAMNLMRQEDDAANCQWLPSAQEGREERWKKCSVLSGTVSTPWSEWTARQGLLPLVSRVASKLSCLNCDRGLQKARANARRFTLLPVLAHRSRGVAAIDTHQDQQRFRAGHLDGMSIRCQRHVCPLKAASRGGLRMSRAGRGEGKFAHSECGEGGSDPCWLLPAPCQGA
jgi:hypothetical protein